MKEKILIIATIFLLSGCAPQVDAFPGSKNENVVTVNTSILDKGKGPMYGPTLAAANKWCGQFNKTAKYLKATLSGYQYACLAE